MDGVRLCMRLLLWLESSGEVARVASGRVRRESSERSRVNCMAVAAGVGALYVWESKELHCDLQSLSMMKE